MTIFRYVGMSTTMTFPAETTEQANAMLAGLLMAEDFYTTRDGVSLVIGGSVHPFTVTKEDL